MVKKQNSIIFREWIEYTFDEMDPFNITNWRGRFNEFVKRSQEIYAAYPEREDKVFGDVWNEFRYDPKNAENIEKLQQHNKECGFPKIAKNPNIFHWQKM